MKRDYYLKDHLRSIRMTLDENSNIVSAQDYYPYGEILRSYTLGSGVNDKYKFTEKERDTETNYDYFGARYYDSELARWTTIDPLWEKYHGWSPYNYVTDNPLNFFDPNGEYKVSADGKRVFRVTQGMNSFLSSFGPLKLLSSAIYSDPKFSITTKDWSRTAIQGILYTTLGTVSALGEGLGVSILSASTLSTNFLIGQTEFDEEHQIKNNLIIDEHIFLLAQKQGMGTVNIVNQGLFDVAENISKERVINEFAKMDAYIKDYLKRKDIQASDLIQEEWEELYNSYLEE